MSTRRAVFLDRDGVLNRAIERDGKPFPPRSTAEVVIPDGVWAACRILSEAGYALVVVTNQPDVSRGIATRADVNAINEFVAGAVGVDAVFTCFEDGSHPDRKPNPGMLLKAARAHALDLKSSWMIGDRFGDILAGQRAGCRTILVGEGWGEPDCGARPTHRCATLEDASRLILTQSPLSKGHA